MGHWTFITHRLLFVSSCNHTGSGPSMIKLYVSSAWASVQSCYVRNFAKLQENMKAMLHGTQPIGLFVQIKRVNSFKENKVNVAGYLAKWRQNHWLKEEVLIFYQVAQPRVVSDSIITLGQVFFLFLFNKINFWMQQLRSQFAGKDVFPSLGSPPLFCHWDELSVAGCRGT